MFELLVVNSTAVSLKIVTFGFYVWLPLESAESVVLFI